MNSIIQNYKDDAAARLEVRREVLNAMAQAGWKLLRDGNQSDINVDTLMLEADQEPTQTYRFIDGDLRYNWKVFDFGEPSLEQFDGEPIHCIDLLCRLRGEEATTQLITQVLNINEYGFCTADIFTNEKVDECKLGERVRQFCGPWRHMRVALHDGSYTYRLYRYNHTTGIYNSFSEEDFVKMCRSLDARVRPAHGISAYNDITSSSDIIVVDAPSTDYIAVRGCRLLDVHTGTTIPCSDSIFITNCVNARWDETPGDIARTNATEGGRLAHVLLNGIESEQDRKVLLQYFAYTLTAGFQLKKCLIVYGNSNCGKSTILQAWTKGVCGNRTTVAFDAVRTFGGGEGSRFALSNWLHKRVAYCDELGASRIPDTGNLKEIVAGEPVIVDIKGLSPQSVVLDTKIIIGTNEVPDLQDNSGAIKNRIIILDLSRDPYDTETSPCFKSYYEDEDFCTVLLRAAVDAINDPSANCWAQGYEGKWFVTRLSEPSEKSMALLNGIRDQSCRGLKVIEAMLEGGTDDIEVGQMLGMGWKEIEEQYKMIYKELNGVEAANANTETLNKMLMNSEIGGKLYQIGKAGTMREGLIQPKYIGRVFYEYSRNEEIRKENETKARRWYRFNKDCNGDIERLRDWVASVVTRDSIESWIQDIEDIKAETERLKNRVSTIDN